MIPITKTVSNGTKYPQRTTIGKSYRLSNSTITNDHVCIAGWNLHRLLGLQWEIAVNVFITFSTFCLFIHRFTAVRAMHFRAKRGLAIACRLSVCPSVRSSVKLVDCDHIGWNSSEIISPLVLAWDVRSLQTQTSLVYSKGNTRKFEPKVTHLRWFERPRHSIANCGRMVIDSATITMESL